MVLKIIGLGILIGITIYNIIDAQTNRNVISDIIIRR